MSMYFYDETDDWPEYKIVQDEIKRLEKAHLECRKELQAAEVAFNSDMGNEELKVRVDVLKKTLEEVEKKLDESMSMYR
ncbi:hypothetical protein ACFL0O_00795 [Thermodesulfobacteriota bacterium]